MSECIFCAVAAGDVPSARVYEDDEVVAFRDVSPQAPTHILVVPRLHVGSLAELTPEHDRLWARMLHVVQGLARTEGVQESGFRVVANTGGDGGQTVAHLHLHLLAGRAMGWPPG